MTQNKISDAMRDVMNIQDMLRRADYALCPVGTLVCAHTAFPAKSLSGAGLEHVGKDSVLHVHELVLDNEKAYHIVRKNSGKDGFVALAGVRDLYNCTLPNAARLEVIGDIIAKKRVIFGLPSGGDDSVIVWQNGERILDTYSITGFRVLAAEYDYAWAKSQRMQNKTYDKYPLWVTLQSTDGSTVYNAAIADAKQWMQEQGQ